MEETVAEIAADLRALADLVAQGDSLALRDGARIARALGGQMETTVRRREWDAEGARLADDMAALRAAWRGKTIGAT